MLEASKRVSGEGRPPPDLSEKGPCRSSGGRFSQPRVGFRGGPPPGRYQLLAAINAVHTDAREARDNDWGQVVQLSDQLLAVAPEPVSRTAITAK